MANGGPTLVPPGTVGAGEPAVTRAIKKAGELSDLVFGKVKSLVGKDPELRAYIDLAEKYVRDFAGKDFASMARRLSDDDKKYLGELLKGVPGLPEAFRDKII